jgi:magnesium transporter
MPHTAKKNETQAHLDQLNEALSSGTFVQVRRMLNSLLAPDVAHLLESSPPKSRAILWKLVDVEREGDILQAMNDEVGSQLIRDKNTDDIADILQQLPGRVISEVLAAMSTQDRLRLESVLSYDEDTAGGLMNTDTITVRPNHTADVVLRYLRRHDEIPEMTDNLIVVNRKDEYLGLLPLRKLLVSDPGMTVREIMQTGIDPISADMSDTDVATLFQRHDWVSAPVVGEDGRLLGRITIDDVVDVIREDADHSLLSMAGLDEDEDTFARVIHAAPRRAMWLGINLITALVASATINIFEDTIDKIVALAILMPIVASMGGVAGSQTLTIVIRGIALGQIGRNNANWLLRREILVGILNGLLWAGLIAVVAMLWFGETKIGIVIALAMFINLLTAAIAGVLLPLAMKMMKIDPALAGSVALTTVTDVVGFVSFLGLATLFYA